MVKERTRAELSREAEVNSQAKVLGSEGRPCVEPKEMRTSYTHSRCIMRIAPPQEIQRSWLLSRSSHLIPSAAGMGVSRHLTKPAEEASTVL